MEIQTWKPFFKEGTWSKEASGICWRGGTSRVVPQRLLLITQWVETGDAVGGRRPQWRNGEKSCTQSTSKQRLLRQKASRISGLDECVVWDEENTRRLSSAGPVPESLPRGKRSSPVNWGGRVWEEAHFPPSSPAPPSPERQGV